MTWHCSDNTLVLERVALVYDAILYRYELTCSSCTNTVEYYNAELDEWTLCAPMNCMRSYLGVGVVGGYLYAVGELSISGVLAISTL